MTFPAARLADVVLDAFGESVRIERPVAGPIDPIAGNRTTQWDGATVTGNVRASDSNRIDTEAPIETAIVAVRAVDLVIDGGVFTPDEKCRVKVVSRDTGWRQVIKVDRVGAMIEIETSRKK